MPNAKYYAEHKEELAQKQKEKKYWLEHYQAHREEVKAKNLARFRKKRDEALAKKKLEEGLKEEDSKPIEPVGGAGAIEPATIDPAIVEAKKKRLDEIVAELKKLVPDILTKGRKRARFFYDDISILYIAPTALPAKE